MSQRFNLTIESALENLPRAVAFVSESLQRLGMAPAMIPKVELAVDEAVTNVIKHAYSGGRGEIALACTREGEDFIITIRDRGKPFDPRSVPPPDLEADVSSRRIGGLGIHFMRTVMDEVSYQFDPGEGNLLTLKKKATPPQESPPEEAE